MNWNPPGETDAKILALLRHDDPEVVRQAAELVPQLDEVSDAVRELAASLLLWQDRLDALSPRAPERKLAHRFIEKLQQQALVRLQGPALYGFATTDDRRDHYETLSVDGSLRSHLRIGPVRAEMAVFGESHTPATVILSNQLLVVTVRQRVLRLSSYALQRFTRKDAPRALLTDLRLHFPIHTDLWGNPVELPHHQDNRRTA